MKWEIVLWSVFSVIGIAASFGNWGHLYFTTLPSLAITLALVHEYKKEQEQKKSKDR